MQADGDNADVEPHLPPTCLFVGTSINRPSTSNLMVESDQEEGDEEDPYSNIGLLPTTMAPTVPIVHQPLSVSPPQQRSSSVVMLSDDEQEADEKQGANQYMQPIALQVSSSVKSTDPSADNIPAPIPSSVITHSSQTDNITPVLSSSNEPQLLQQVTKPQKVKKTLTDISRRFSTRILQKKAKSGEEQDTVKGKQRKKDLEMQPISRPLTPVAQAVTDRLYNNDDKISKGGPVKRSSTKKATPKATRGEEDQEKFLSE